MNDEERHKEKGPGCEPDPTTKANAGAFIFYALS